MFYLPEASGFFIIILQCSEKVCFLWKVPFYWYLACLSGIKAKIVNVWLQCNNFVFCADNILLLKLLFVPCVWNLLQIKYIFLRNSYFLKIKSFSFSCLLYYYLKVSARLFFLRLYWVFIKGAISVSSKQVAVCVILIFKTLHFFVFVCYVLFWACFWLRDFGLFVVVVFVIDFAVEWWGLVSKKKNKGLTVHCNVAFVKPYVKMSVVWSMRLFFFWFWWVLFVVKTLLYSERRFASNTS